MSRVYYFNALIVASNTFIKIIKIISNSRVLDLLYLKYKFSYNTNIHFYSCFLFTELLATLDLIKIEHFRRFFLGAVW
jgi:hypothetical protein